jgi:hypothetical protein
MRVRVASGVLLGSPSLQGKYPPRRGEGGEEWRGGPLWSPAIALQGLDDP